MIYFFQCFLAKNIRLSSAPFNPTSRNNDIVFENKSINFIRFGRQQRAVSISSRNFRILQRDFMTREIVPSNPKRFFHFHINNTIRFRRLLMVLSTLCFLTINCILFLLHSAKFLNIRW